MRPPCRIAHVFMTCYRPVMKRAVGRQALGMARVTIITGPRDSGKTRAAAAAAEQMQRNGTLVGGVIAEAELAGGIKVRYFLRDVLTGAKALYAVRRPGPIPPGAMAYLFIDEGLEFGRAAVRRGIDAGTGTAAVVIDEIGPLEMAGAGLWETVREAVTGFPGRIILTVRPALLDTLREKLELAPAEVDVIQPDADASPR